MRTRATVSILVLVALVVVVRLGFAKGIPAKIVLTGAGLTHAVEVDSVGRRIFNPWSAAFIDWRATPVVNGASLCVSQPFDARFYMKWPGRTPSPDYNDLSLIYAVKYCRASNGEGGLVHLPGIGEQYYTTNSGTILRQGQDGGWFRASRAWDSVVTTLIAH
jgi:hypothetical protein